LKSKETVPEKGRDARPKPWTTWRLVLFVAVPAILGLAQARFLYAFLNRGEVHPAASQHNAFGPLTLHLKLPGTNAGIPEPLCSIGRPGRASLIFIRLLKGSRAKVGVEFWGNELSEGDVFQLPAADAEIDVTCYVPAFFPSADDPIWGTTPASRKDRLTREYRILVDGTERLSGSTSYEEPEGSPLYIGANPLGGSFVSNLFTGKVLAVKRAK
jgi:hypothetical protein